MIQGSESTQVFVYGTLLQGEGNHHLLLRDQFLGAALTTPSFSLHDLGSYPGMVGGGTQSIEGEVYVVGPHTLARLDMLEGHPDFYHRIGIALEDGSTVETYLLPPDSVAGCPVIVSGSWRTHRRERGRRA